MKAQSVGGGWSGVVTGYPLVMFNDQTMTCLSVFFNNMTFLLYICATYFGIWNWVF